MFPYYHKKAHKTWLNRKHECNHIQRNLPETPPEVSKHTLRCLIELPLGSPTPKKPYISGYFDTSVDDVRTLKRVNLAKYPEITRQTKHLLAIT